MDRNPMTSEWYYAKQTTSGVESVGPVSWEELCRLARAGELGPADHFWNPGSPQWVPAELIPALFAASSPAWPLPAGLSQEQSRRRLAVLAWLLPLIAIIIVAAGLGTYFGAFYDHGSEATGAVETAVSEGGTSPTQTVPGVVTGATGTTVDPASISGSMGMGAAECKAPERTKLIQTVAWGEVPSNQIIVTLADGRSREDAVAVAQTLGGSLVGEIEFINAYQIETAGSSEADLRAAIDKAAASAGVESAFPNQEAQGDAEFMGVRQTPLDDPAYQEGRGRGFELIGAQKAWDYVRGCGLHVWDVHVGVVDNGLFKGIGEFSGDVDLEFPDPSAGELGSPQKLTNSDTGRTVDDPAGSHGTMVTGLIGADPNNGGTTGVASVLGDHLTISMINNFTGRYGKGDKCYSFGSLVAIAKQIEDGAKVISCSWGSKVDPNNADSARMYRAFLQEMATEHPDVTFVFAAGNEGRELSSYNLWPAGAGANLPNVIIVGNVMNDGSLCSSSNIAGPDGEVTLAAPGQEVVRGVDAEGNPVTNVTDLGIGRYISGGTSAAAPQVSAAAALLLALDPNLTAAEIKDILIRTARPGPPGVGGRILAVDQAVLEVINRLRDEQGLPPVTGEELKKAGGIDAVATTTGESDVFSVRGILAVVPEGGTEVTISGSYGVVVEGETAQWIDAPGEVVWPVVRATVEDPQRPTTITVTRKDNGAASVITLKIEEARAWELEVETVWNDAQNGDVITVTWKSEITLDPDDGTLSGFGEGTWHMDGSIYRDISRPELGFEGTMRADGALSISISGRSSQKESGQFLRIEPGLGGFTVESQAWSPATGMQDAHAQFEAGIQGWVADSLTALEFTVTGNDAVSISIVSGGYVGSATLTPLPGIETGGPVADGLQGVSPTRDEWAMASYRTPHGAPWITRLSTGL